MLNKNCQVTGRPTHKYEMEEVFLEKIINYYFQGHFFTYKEM